MRFNQSEDPPCGAGLASRRPTAMRHVVLGEGCAMTDMSFGDADLRIESAGNQTGHHAGLMVRHARRVGAGRREKVYGNHCRQKMFSADQRHENRSGAMHRSQAENPLAGVKG